MDSNAIDFTAVLYTLIGDDKCARDRSGILAGDDIATTVYV